MIHFKKHLLSAYSMLASRLGNRDTQMKDLGEGVLGEKQNEEGGRDV